MKNREISKSLVDFLMRRFEPGMVIRIDSADNKQIIGKDFTISNINDEGIFTCIDENNNTVELDPLEATFYKLNDTPMIGFGSDGSKERLTNAKEVSHFILKQGCRGNANIYLEETGEFVLNTIGIFLDRIADMDYRTELLTVLIPMQKSYGMGPIEAEEQEEPEVSM